MAAARKCDACGKLYEIYGSFTCGKDKPNVDPNGIRFTVTDKDGYIFNDDIIDLCPDCMNAVKGVLDLGKSIVNRVKKSKKESEGED